MEEIKKKRGRPIRGSARNIRFGFRTSEEQIRRLKVASQLSGKSQTDILREALDKELNLIGVLGAIRTESDDEYMYDECGYYDEYGEDDEYMPI